MSDIPSFMNTDNDLNNPKQKLKGRPSTSISKLNLESMKNEINGIPSPKFSQITNVL